MGVLIDATVLVDHERRRLDVGRLIDGREDEPFFLSVITVSELLHGVHRAADGPQRAKRSVFVEAVVDRFPILEVNLPTARIHAEVSAELAAAGTPLGAHDLWLAAAALAHDLTLATATVREFERVQGLSVERWAFDAQEP